MYKYKRVVLDIETTGLSCKYDEILQVSIIDQYGNVLIDTYCKPQQTKEWEEAEAIHRISPDTVKDKEPFEFYSKQVESILDNTETIIIYNADFEIGFLNKYDIKVNSKIYDLMLEFAEEYGQWNEYYGNFTWQSLSTCCLYYGYDLSNAHNSLDDCKATLYCYNKLIGKEGQYEASEYIGKTVKQFIDEVKEKLDNRTISRLSIYPNNRVDEIGKGIYFTGKVNGYEDVKYIELLDKKIKKIRYTSPREFSICVENSIQCDFDLLKEEIEMLKEINANLKTENIKLRERGFDNFKLYNTERGKVDKLQKQLYKMKEKLGLVLKREPKIAMYNSYGFYTADYCRNTKKPMIQQAEYSTFKDVLLSKSRCKEIKEPVKENETIYAFLRARNGYCALYLRKVGE